jgi:hypothetical protein
LLYLSTEEADRLMQQSDDVVRVINGLIRHLT